MTRSPRPTKDQGAGVPASPSGHSPKGGAASSTASPAKPSVPNAHEQHLQKLRETEILAVSSSACFYPECDNPDEFDGSTITWTFELPKSSRDVGSGVYRLQFVRTLGEEKALGNPVLSAASGIETEGQDAQRLGAEHESPTAESGDAHTSGQSPPLSQGDE